MVVNPEKKYYLEVSWHTLWRVFIFIGLAVLMFLARDALGAFLVAIVLSLGIDPAVGFLERRGIGRLFGTVILFLGTALVFAGVIYLATPIIITEAVGFLGDFNESISSIFGIRLPPTFIKGVSTNLSRVLSVLSANNISVTVAVSAVLSKVVFFVAALMISFYLSIEKNGAERLLRVVLPNMYEKPVLTVFSRFKVKIRRWLGTQFALSALVGAVVSIGLFFLGVRYPVVLGLLAGVLEIVPIIGPIVAGLAAFLVAVGDSFSTGLYVAVFFVLVQQLENHILIPIIMGKTMKVHPVVVLFSLLAGGRVAGFVGVLLAVPIAIFMQEVLNYLAEQKEKAGAGA